MDLNLAITTHLTNNVNAYLYMYMMYNDTSIDGSLNKLID